MSTYCRAQQAAWSPGEEHPWSEASLAHAPAGVSGKSFSPSPGSISGKQGQRQPPCRVRRQIRRGRKRLAPVHVLGAHIF